MDGERIHFFKDNECVSLHAREMDPVAGTPATHQMRKLTQAATIVTAVIALSSFVAVFLVDHYHCGKLQEVIQLYKSYIDNSSTWPVEIQNLKCRVNNVSSQIQELAGHLGETSADTQMARGALQEASDSSQQTQLLQSSLEGASVEIQKLKEDMGKTQGIAFQTHSILQNTSEKNSVELHKLSRGLESVSTEIQMLEAGLEMADTQVRLANSSLKNVHSEIYALRGHLDSFNDLRTQNQVLRSGLEGARAEIQKLEINLQTANALSSQTQALLQGRLDNTSAEILVLRGHLETTEDEMHLLKRDLETVTAQIQLANGHMEQTDAQVQLLKAEQGNASALNSQVQVLQGQLESVSGEIQTLKQGVKDTAALNSQMQRLGSNLQKASAELQRLKEVLENNKTEEQSHLATLRAAIASQEQLQRTQSQLLQLILQGWKIFRGNLYYFSIVKKSWHEAEKFCVSQGTHLMSVTSEEEQAFLVQVTSASYHWIGLTDHGTEGSWYWTDGSPFSAAESRRMPGLWGYCCWRIVSSRPRKNSYWEHGRWVLQEVTLVSGRPGGGSPDLTDSATGLGTEAGGGFGTRISQTTGNIGAGRLKTVSIFRRSGMTWRVVPPINGSARRQQARRRPEAARAGGALLAAALHLLPGTELGLSPVASHGIHFPPCLFI